MNRSCYGCRNNRRQLLMLKCTHDVCVKCAADNYFINCKNKLTSKKQKPKNYFCQKCLEQTQIDNNTIDVLRKYFLDNVIIDQKDRYAKMQHRQNRKAKINQRDQINKQKMQKISKLDQSSNRPKSLEIQILEKKRTLSKYLNDKQIQKYFEMQKEYGNSHRLNHANKIESNNTISQPRPNNFSPNAHKIGNNHLINKKQVHQSRKPIMKIRELNSDYELQELIQYKYKKDDNKIKPSLQIFNKYDNHFTDYQNLSKHRDGNYDKLSNQQQSLGQNDIYHNGKVVAHYNSKLTNHLLQQKQKDNYYEGRTDSNSSKKRIGTIRSKNLPNHGNNSPVSNKITEQNKKLLKIAASRSQNDLHRINRFRNQVMKQYSPHFVSNSSDMWQLQNKSTKRNIQDKTVLHLERKSIQNMEKILQHMQLSDNLIKDGQKLNQRNLKNSQQMLKIEQFYCKIHQDQQIIYFCMKCNQMICSECALHSSHKNHEIHSLKKTAQNLYQKLNHKMNTLLKYIVDEQSKENIYKECINEIIIEYNKQKQKIKTSFETFIYFIDKKYKQVLKDIEDKFQELHSQYNQRLSQTRKNIEDVNRIKEKIDSTIGEYNSYECKITSQNNISNKYATFNLNKYHNNHHLTNVQFIKQITTRIQQLKAFTKQTNILLFSNKKGSLLSQNQSLKLSQSQNLLEENDELYNPTPSTNTMLISSKQKYLLPPQNGKKIITNSYQINTKSHIKMINGSNIVQYLRQIQEIIKSIKLETVQYEIKALI